MRILLINPNTSQSFTEKVQAIAEKYASPGTQVVATNPETGPRSIESIYDELLSSPGTLEVALANLDQFDAFVIVCYSDHPPFMRCARSRISLFWVLRKRRFTWPWEEVVEGLVGAGAAPFAVRAPDRSGSPVRLTLTPLGDRRWRVHPWPLQGERMQLHGEGCRGGVEGGAPDGPLEGVTFALLRPAARG